MKGILIDKNGLKTIFQAIFASSLQYQSKINYVN